MSTPAEDEASAREKYWADNHLKASRSVAGIVNNRGAYIGLDDEASNAKGTSIIKGHMNGKNPLHKSYQDFYRNVLGGNHTEKSVGVGGLLRELLTLDPDKVPKEIKEYVDAAKESINKSQARSKQPEFDKLSDDEKLKVIEKHFNDGKIGAVTRLGKEVAERIGAVKPEFEAASKGNASYMEFWAGSVNRANKAAGTSPNVLNEKGRPNFEGKGNFFEGAAGHEKQAAATAPKPVTPAPSTTAKPN